MTKIRLFLGMLALMAVYTFWLINPASAAMPAGATLDFKNELEWGYPEQDVFVASDSNTNQVMRVDVANRNNSTMLGREIFKSATATAHDYFKTGANALGPFNKGASLSMTLQEWLRAGGEGSYLVRGNNATLDLSFNNLVPGGAYSLWCTTLSQTGSSTAGNLYYYNTATAGYVPYSSTAGVGTVGNNPTLYLRQSNGTYTSYNGSTLYYKTAGGNYVSYSSTAGVGTGITDTTLYTYDSASATYTPYSSSSNNATLYFYNSSTGSYTAYSNTSGVGSVGNNPTLYSLSGSGTYTPYSGSTLYYYNSASGTYAPYSNTVGTGMNNNPTLYVKNSDNTYTAYSASASNGSGSANEAPCVSISGSTVAFRADQNGNATLKTTIPRLNQSSGTRTSLIQVVYHSNDSLSTGSTSFGSERHVLISAAIPTATENGCLVDAQSDYLRAKLAARSAYLRALMNARASFAAAGGASNISASVRLEARNAFFAGIRNAHSDYMGELRAGMTARQMAERSAKNTYQASGKSAGDLQTYQSALEQARLNYDSAKASAREHWAASRRSALSDWNNTLLGSSSAGTAYLNSRRDAQDAFEAAMDQAQSDWDDAKDSCIR